MITNCYILEIRFVKYFSSFSFPAAYIVIDLCLRNALKNYGGGNPMRPLKQREHQQIASGNDDFKCGLKDIFRDALYIYTRVYAPMCMRERRAIYVSATLSTFHATFFVVPRGMYVRACVLAPDATLWNPAYGMQCETQSCDFIFDHRPATFANLCGA